MANVITKSDVEKFMGLTIDASLDTFILVLIQGAQDFIFRACGGGIVEKRWFNDGDVSATRYYDGNGATRLEVDDIRALTSLVVDGVALVENTDFFLYPLNETVKEWIELIQPETRLATNSRIDSTSPYIFDEGQRSVTIVGKFGYSTDATAPDLIKVCALKIVSGFIKENIGDSDLKEITSESLGDYSVSFAKITETANRMNMNDMLASFTRQPIGKSASGVLTVS